jgi:hypothetical protein
MDLLALKVTGHGRELQISFPLYYCNKIILLTSCPVTLRANKSIKMKFFQKQNFLQSVLKYPKLSRYANSKTMI